MSGFFQFPPLHPILVHFPVALLPIAVVCDVLGCYTRRISLTHAGWWPLLFASLAAPLTAASGWLWLREMGGMDQPEMVIHQWLGTVIPFLLIPLAYWRYRFHSRDSTPSLKYLVAASIILLAVTVQGHLGGMISFGSTMKSNTEVSNTATSNAPVASTQETGQRSPTTSDKNGWTDSIKVKGHRHE